MQLNKEQRKHEMVTGNEAPNSKMVLEKSFSESGGGNKQTDYLFTLRTEGKDKAILTKVVSESRYPSGVDTPISKEEWSISAAEIIAFIQESGAKIS